MYIVYIFAACLLGLFMTWGVGANDLANIMSTTMGSKAVSVRQAIFIAVVFEFAGAFFGGEHVTQTIRSGIINLDSTILTVHPHYFVYGMLAVLMAGTTWMLTASYYGLPVSITNAIVGSLVGFGLIVLGSHAVHWQKVTYIAISWVSSPLIAGIVGYFLFISIQRFILIRKDPDQAVLKYAPYYFFMVGIVLSIMILIKGLRHFNIELALPSKILIEIASGFLMVLIGYLITKKIKIGKDKSKTRLQFIYVEKIFAVLMGFTACAMVFAHGSNDVAIAMGPVIAVVTMVVHGQQLSDVGSLQNWVIFLGCTGVVLGLVMYGRKVIETVGHGITALTPSRAFAATIAAASTVIVSTSTGIPVSATQTLVGAVFGVGLARGIGALNLRVIRNILLSWVVTLPVASLLAIAFFYLLQWV